MPHHDLPQPFSLCGDWPMQPTPKLFLYAPELRPHAVATGLPLKLEKPATQFAASLTLAAEILDAVMNALNAHEAMSSQAFNSQKVRDGLNDILLRPGELYEALRSTS